MMLLYNITLKDIICPAELESESLPSKWVCERSSMEPLLLLLWVQRILTIMHQTSDAYMSTNDHY